MRPVALVAVALASLALLAACSSSGNATSTPAAGGGTAAATGTAATTGTTAPGGGQVGAGKTVDIGYVPGWDEGVAATYLWQELLQEQGYQVKLTSLDVAPLYAGIAQGDVDMYLDAWLPGTHKVYMDKFQGKLNELHTWYSPAGLYLTVPSYVKDVNSLANLADHKSEFNGKIIGIEAGAGMMGIARDKVMPNYGLSDWTLVEGSTPAMLAELQKAINAQEPIVVTLWSPGWWYGKWDLKNLKDPKNAWGPPDHISVVTRNGFTDDFPAFTKELNNFHMDDAPLASLENTIKDAGKGNEAKAVKDWLSKPENRKLADGWIGE